MHKSTVSPGGGKTDSKVRQKPDKPRPDFPLYAHASGRWAKKVRGKTLFFGKWDDPQAALDKWLDEKDALLAGRKPRPKHDGLKLLDLVNAYLTVKKQRLNSNEITQRTFDRYYATGEFLLGAMGKSRFVEDILPEDLGQLRAKMADRWGPVALAVEIQYVRSVLDFGYANDLVEKPVRYGTHFDKPSRKTLRIARARRGKRVFTPAEIKASLKKASVNVKAFILLGLQGGLGNSDIAELKIAQVDGSGWLDAPRVKTGIDRRIPLWAETEKALRQVLKHRPAPEKQEDAELLFIGQRGSNYVGTRNGDRIYKPTKKVFPDGRSFYDLRHTFETVGGECGDQVAVDYLMGHAPDQNNMSAVYRESISDKRLRAVVDHVHAWLWPPKEKAGKGKGGAK